MPVLYDPAEEPCDDNYSTYRDYRAQGQASIQGPGGKTTIVENNEKGILEENIFGVLRNHRQAALGSDHDSYAQGIYMSHHETGMYLD